jgi:hypothetical protein
MNRKSTQSHSIPGSPLARSGAVLFSLLLAPCARAWTPGTGSPNATGGFAVDPANRADVLSFHNCIYTASENYASKVAWTGSVTGCVAGTTAAAFKDDVLRRINFYRALSGLPATVSFDPAKSADAQQAALMMSRNDALSHAPPPTWECYTAAGANAAGRSNLAYGSYGPSAVNGFMEDSGGGNEVVGHRRWLLYSLAVSMGTGDIPGDGGYPQTNAIWVIGDPGTEPAPAFAAWPNRGYSPFPLMPARWSLSYPNANFGAATVTMTVNGAPVSTNVISTSANGYGDNTIVWEPGGLPTSVTTDVVCNVTVSGISGAGGVTSYSYPVNLFDPGRLGDSVTISGPATPPVSGAGYTFNSIQQADSYELRVSTAGSGTWTEGAEDMPAPRIEEHISGGYSLRQSDLVRLGSKAFHLVIPDFEDQSFVVTRDIVPSASSKLEWFDRARFTTTTTTLDAEISTDAGMTWTSVFGRNGVGLSSGLWDEDWISRSVSLAAYSGQIMRVRFILRGNGQSVVTDSSSNSGFFIDDITVTNARQLSDAQVTTLPGSATSFTLDAATAGAPLAAGSSYFMRIRPYVGCRWFGDGAVKVVSAQSAAGGYAAWVANQYPAVTEGVAGDHDADGILNGVEYAFGLDPLVFTSQALLPHPVRSDHAFSVSYDSPAGISDVVYGARWSDDLLSWHDIPDTGTGGSHIFSADTTGHDRLFFSHRVVITP